MALLKGKKVRIFENSNILNIANNLFLNLTDCPFSRSLELIAKNKKSS